MSTSEEERITIKITLSNGAQDHVEVYKKMLSDDRTIFKDIFTVRTNSRVNLFGGRVYQSYPEAREAKMKHNQKYLQKLGIGGNASLLMSLDQTNNILFKNEKKRKNIKTKTSNPLKVQRRSSRNQGKSPAYTGETINDGIYNFTSEQLLKKNSQTSKQPLKNRQRRLLEVKQTPLTHNQRATLVTASDWLERLRTFLLLVPHGRNHKVCSVPNADTVMRQVRKLVSGQGVHYRYWPKHVIFSENKPVTLNDDFDQLYNSAVEYQNKYGRDRGNGWLLLHPIEKLRCYQQHIYEQTKTD